MILSVLSSFLWLGFVEILALGLLPLWCLILSSSAEKVIGYSRVLSLLSLTWITWLIAQYGKAPFDLPLILLVSIFLVAIGHLTLRLKFTSWRVFLYDQKLNRPYLSYLIALLLILGFRLCNSEIFWGEKPLEFSILNYLTRETSLPAEHPWAAGSNMSYYYLGFFALAILQKISFLDSSIGFNLGIALTGASLFAAFQAVFLNLRLTFIGASLSAALLTFGANLNPVYLALIEGKESSFDLFWMSTRNFTNPAFAEYPIWSILFADLHPHVMAMPLVVCLIGIVWSAAFQEQNRHSHRVTLLILSGTVWGLLYSVNGWDFITTAILLAILFAFSEPISFSWRWIKLQSTFVITLTLAALAVVLPFRFSQVNMFAAYWGWVTTDEFNKIIHIFLHQGLALSIIICCSLGLWVLKKSSNRLAFPEISLFLLSLLPLAVGTFSKIYSTSGQAWHIIIFSVFISFIGLIFYSFDYRSRRLRFCCLLIMSGAALITISESFYFIDRMNTIFKGYQILWPAFGITACVLLSEFSSQLATRNTRDLSTLRIATTHSLHGLIFSVIAVSLMGTIINLSIILPMKRTSNARFSLNGTSYLERDNQDEAYLIRWLQNNVPGKAYIAEAHGDGYQAYTRVTMHTGLPSLLGWEHHSKQGGVPSQEIEKRKLAIKKIFTETNVEETYKLLQHYGIDFIFVGKLETEKYSETTLSKFATNPEYFIPVAWQGDYVIYLTNFSPLKSSIENKQRSNVE